MTDWTAVGAIAGAAAVGLGLGEAVFRFARRPRLALALDEDRVHSRVEADRLPYVRLLVSNGRFRRGARGARLLVESYRAPGQPLAERVTLGSPQLGWTSGGAETRADGSLTVPPGVTRTIDFGYLICGKLDAHGAPQPPSAANPWGFHLALHELRLLDGRDWLPHGRWVVRLIATANDAAPRTYDVTVECGMAEATPEHALRSVILSIAEV